MNDSDRWPNSHFPCHGQHEANDVLIDPLHGGRQFSARCPECDKSYRITPRTFSADGEDIPVVVWTLVLPNGTTVVIPPLVDGIDESNAPLFQDVPWPSRWPMDPRRPGNGAWSLPRVSVEDVRRDGYAATAQRLALDADWGDTARNTHLVHVIEPVAVHEVTVVDPGEVLVARRGWVWMRPDAVVLASARSVSQEVVISRGFLFVDRPLDVNLSPPHGAHQAPVEHRQPRPGVTDGH